MGRVADNGDGQLGDGGTTNATIATLRAGGTLSGKTIRAVYAGPNYAMAVDSLGNLHAWGTNSYGQLGNGTLSNQFTPVQSVTGGVSDVYIGQYDYNITYIKKTDCWRRSNIDHLGVRLKTWTCLRHKSETLSVF